VFSVRNELILKYLYKFQVCKLYAFLENLIFFSAITLYTHALIMLCYNSVLHCEVPHYIKFKEYIKNVTTFTSSGSGL